MKYTFTKIMSLSLISLSTLAQDNNSLIPCNTYQVMEEQFKKDENLKTKYNLIQSQLDLEYKQAIENQNNATAKTAAVVYTVPVVFHILHQGGVENVSDADINAAMAQINKDYSKLGSDVGTINPSFSSLYVDAEIRFQLAKKDPNGNCTNGIIRHYDANTNWDQTNIAAYAYSGSGTGRWPVNKYLNIYIVKCIYGTGSSCPTTSGGIIVGYTYLPGSSPVTSADVIVYRYDFLASGTVARSLSHEMGHWLNLQHTWGSTNNAGVACGDDGVGDTPISKGYYSTCPGGNTGPFSGCSATENMENFMDYSSCPKMFSQGQVTRMRTAITSSTAGRNNLWSSTNLLATGITPSYTCVPMADLSVNKTTICAGSSLTYTSLSQYGTSGSVSWIFQGGTPATSTATSPTVVYNTPGTYSVSITANNPYGSNTKNKTSYITVVSGGGGYIAPISHDFEAFGLPSDIPVTNGNAGSVTWTQNSSNGASGTAKSIYINNASVSGTGGHIDYFETPIYDFKTTSNVTMSFYYAYAKKTASQADTFKLQISTDCGGTWINVLGAPSTAVMATNSAGTTSTPLNPTSTQWKQHVISSGLFGAMGVNNPNLKPSVKFRFWFKTDAATGSSNNIFIDQINLSGTVGLNELENAIELLLYPNPSSATATLSFKLYDNQKAKINVLDVLGRVVETTDKVANTDNIAKYTINKTGNLAKGIYFVNVEINNTLITKKLIIE